MGKSKGTPAQSRVEQWHDQVRCTSIKPWEFDGATEPTVADLHIASKMAAQLLRCTLLRGHGGAHAIAPQYVGDVAAVWFDPPPVYFTTTPSEPYT